MKKIKRLGFLITALCATCALAFATACTDDPPLDPEPTTGDETYIFPADDDPIVYGSPLSGDGTPFIKYDAAGSARYCWLRSPYPGHANGERLASTSGALSDHSAYGGYGVAPACIIA